MRYLSRVPAYLFVALVFALGAGCTPVELRSPVAPKNVVIFIGDGMGYGQVEAGSLYKFGERGRQVYERFPVRYGMSTYSANGKAYAPDSAWATFDYVKARPTDSAAAATAMSTGVKTYNGAICVDVGKNSLKNLMERAKEVGKSAGVVTSVELSHATPAGFVAHNVARGNYAEIAREMFLASKLDVIMGCGNPSFDNNGDSLAVPDDFKYVGGEAVWRGVLAGATSFDTDGDGTMDAVVQDVDGDGVPDPWTLVQDRAAFQALASGPTPKRVLSVPKVRDTLQNKRFDERGTSLAAYRDDAPYALPLTETVPTLAEMTRAALNVLRNNPNGFVLMVEGGAIDWCGNLSGRLIEEQTDFDRAIEAAVNWVEQHGGWDETLVIVTADHDTGYLTGPGSGTGEDGKPVWNPLVNHGKGNVPGMQWNSGHTTSLVPFFAKGAGSEQFAQHTEGNDPKRGPYIDNTAIGKVVFALLSRVSVQTGTR